MLIDRSPRLDSDAIKATLESRIEELVRCLLPAGRREGRQWVIGDVGGNPGQSLHVELTGPKVGLWHDHATNEGGDVLALIAATQQINEFPDVLKWAADWLGVSPPPPITNGQDRKAQAYADAELKRKAAQEIWKSIARGENSLAEKYLIGRAITVALPPSIRFAPNLRHEPTGIDLPALVAGVQDIDGNCIAIVRIYLAIDGKSKAGVSNPKLTLGGIRGGAVRLAPVAETLIITEGIENGLSCQQATGIGAWAGLGSNVRNVNLSPETTTVIAAADNDANEAGRGHAEALAARLHAEGRTVRIAYPPEPGTDWNDMLRQDREDEIKTLIENAPVWTPLEPPQSEAVHDDGADGDEAIDDDAEITRLARLSITQYERERKAAAERLGLRTTVLDKLVRAERPIDDSDRQGRALQLPEPEPWHAPVDGAALLSETAHTIRRYVVLSDHAADAAALWTVHAHVVDASNTSPRLFLTSPEKRCGKTTTLLVLSRIVPRPLQVANISPAPLFRTIEIARPTMLLDEADAFATGSEELRGIINAGHQREGTVIRAVGDDHEPRLFSVWAAMAIAGIGSMPATIEDRSIIVRLRRRRPDEELQRLRMDRTPDLDRLASMAARWSADHMGTLTEADPDVPDALHDRAADNWRAMLAIADAAGGDWPERARSAAMALSNTSEPMKSPS